MNFKKKKKKIAGKIYERMSRNQIKLSRVRILWYLFFSVIFDNNHGSLFLEGKLDIRLGLH